MSAEWHYTKDGQRHGPVSAAELKALAKSGDLSPDDMVWKEGMAGWKPAGSLKGLFPPAPAPTEAASPRSAPPPLPAPSSGGASPEVRSHPLVRKLLADKLLLVGCGLGLSVLLTVALPGRLRGVFFILDVALGVGTVCFAYRRLTSTPTDKLYESGTPELPFPSPWSRDERSAPNKPETIRRLAAAGVGVLMLFALYAAESEGEALFALWLACVVVFLLIFGPISRLFLKAKWVPAEGGDGWLQFGDGGTFIREDGTSGVYKVLPNYVFVDVWQNGSLIDSFKIVSSAPLKLELQHRDGRIVKYSRSMSAGEALVLNPLALLEDTPEQKRDRRLSRLRAKWEPVNGEGPAIQFTDDEGGGEDGAYLRFDGFAARYRLSAKAPFDNIEIRVAGEQVSLKIISLERDELVLGGDGGSVHYRRGVSISAAEARKRADAFNDKLKTVGKAALATVGVVGAGIAVLGIAAAATSQTTCPWCGFTRTGLHMNCPGCGRYS